mmetsp:Transcript_34793/g.55804  ORF Transcript_34793/g.55804 Transcript_34793/m.55804 type:complete len:298 (+) Transcript_34793:518-1411(+)
MPKDKQVAKSLHDENLWDPSGEELKTLPEIYNTVEVSNPCIRCIIMKFGCHNIRPLKYFFGSVGQPANFEQDKPCRVGGCISCAVVSSIYQIGNSESPDTRKRLVAFVRILITIVSSIYQIGNSESPGTRKRLVAFVRILITIVSSIYQIGNSESPDTRKEIGRVRANFDNYPKSCFDCLCRRTHTTNIELFNDKTLQFENKFKMIKNKCCCGRSNNCCGATCFSNDKLLDIVDNDGKVVPHLQKTHGVDEDGIGGCCRCAFNFNYMLSFPEGATEVEKTLVLAAALQTEVAYFDSG